MDGDHWTQRSLDPFASLPPFFFCGAEVGGRRGWVAAARLGPDGGRLGARAAIQKYIDLHVGTGAWET